MSLYTKLGENFDNPNGTLDASGGLVYEGTASGGGVHYDIRSFHSDKVTGPFNMLDMRYWNATHFDNLTMAQMNAQRELSDQAQENWTWDGTQNEVTIDRRSSWNWANTLQALCHSGVLRIITSSYNEDLSIDVGDIISVLLLNFPAQSAGTHLDLNNSFIEFTSSVSWAPSETDSIPFSASSNDLSGGGSNITFQFNRSLLVNANLAAIKGVRFKLLATGGGTCTFETPLIRLSAGGDPNDVSIDTKRQSYARAWRTQAGFTPMVQRDGGSAIFANGRPKNVSLISKFHNGKNPTAIQGRHQQYYFLRLDDSTGQDPINELQDCIYVVVNSQNDLVNIEVHEINSLVDSTLFTDNYPALAEDTDYYVKIELVDTELVVSIHDATGALLGNNYTQSTGAVTVNRVYRGKIGFQTFLNFFDFYLHYIAVENAEFATYRQTTLSSVTPIIGVTLAEVSSDETDLAEGISTYNLIGDGTLVTSTDFGNPAPSLKVVRNGSTFIGGVKTANAFHIGNPKEVTLVGDIFVSNIRGDYRTILMDQYDAIGFIGYIRDIIPNQWTSFSVPVSEDMVGGFYYLSVQQAGFYADTFYVDNLRVNHHTIRWEAASDPSGTYQVFGNAINKPFTGIKLQDPKTSLSIRATALSDTAWWSEFEIIPKYGFIGR